MEVVLKNIEQNNFKNLNMIFKDNSISAIYDEDNTNISEIVSLLVKIKNGVVLIDNEKYDKIPKKIRKEIGYVVKFSDNYFFNNTVLKEFEISLKLSQIKYDISLIKDILQLVKLDEIILKRNPFTLSNGEKRKLALALVLITKPKFLVLDSPFIGLDNTAKKEMIKLIKKIQNDYKMNIVLITNNIEDIYTLANYVYILKNNRIILEGDRSVIYRKYDVLLNEYIQIPKLVSFSNFVLREKYIKLGYRYEINDLIKDIYRNVR